LICFPPKTAYFSLKIADDKIGKVGKKLVQGGKYYIVPLLLKLISKKLSRKEGGKHRHIGKEYFPQYTVCESRPINCMA
jgi:hypothetical protein